MMNTTIAREKRFTLLSRSKDDVVKARPFNGDKVLTIKSATGETLKKHRATIEALSKV